MQVIVITGSTRGIGLGMAHQFLKRGCAVVISGRSQTSVDAAIEQLAQDYETERILGQPCDVGVFEQVQTLWDAAVEQFGKVDYWLNNAGVDLPTKALWDLPHSDLEKIVDTNLLGVMYGSQVAMRGMLKQQSGQIFNMEGLGSDGRMQFGFTPYGTTKYALRYFTKSLQKEAKDNPVMVGIMSPGMVVTDMLVHDFKDKPHEWERTKRIFNILADDVETVTTWLVEKMLANDKDDANFQWLTRSKIALRFLTAPFKKRDLFKDFSFASVGDYS